MSKQNHKSLLRNWSIRYFLVMLAAAVLGACAILFALYQFAPDREVVQSILQFRPQRLLFFSFLLLCGWGMIYLLTRHLVKPIQEAVEAARQIVAGNYNIQLDKQYKEHEIQQLMLAFQEMAQRLKKLEELRAQLLAGVTHELKTPVASTSGMVQAVREGIVSGKKAEQFLDHSLMQLHRLEQMIEDLLNFNRFASDSLMMSREQFDLKEAMYDMAERWRLGLREKDFALHFESDKRVHSWRVNCDPVRIEQIMVNLLNNALEASYEVKVEGIGPGKVSPEKTELLKIEVRLMARDEQFLIQVHNSKGEIKPADRPYIFEPFYRGEEKRRKIRGLGMGLPFSRRIARSLGGDLILSENDPVGTTFILSIPNG